MRTLVGRGYWGPRERNEHLRRFAFVGDSFVFGQGVGPDETLPACAERYLNEALGGWPVEAVNLGVNGYNIWNAWLEFKRAPQVYDAIVLTLCNNDAQLFGRTFRVEYESPNTPLWEREHLFHEPIAACFDEISAFSGARKIPVAVCYYNFWAAKEHVQIGEIINELCSSRGIPFVDFFSHFTERNLAVTDLTVNEVDLHPSRLGHDAAARHLVFNLGKTEAFASLRDDRLDKAPSRIMSAVQDLARQDQYPTDIALHWAISALECKHRVARRAQLLDSMDGFALEMTQASERLKYALKDWHLQERTAATLAKATTHENGIASPLSRIDDEMLRLEELGFAIKRSDGQRLTALLPRPTIDALELDPELWFADARRALDEYRGDFENLIVSCRRDGHGGDTAWIRSREENSRIAVNLEEMAKLCERTKTEISDFSDVLNRLEQDGIQSKTCLCDDARRRYLELLRLSVTDAVESFRNIRRMLLPPQDGVSAEGPAHTTIEITLGTSKVDEENHCLLEIQLNSEIPRRFPLRNACAFRLNGSRVLMTFRFPVVYAGKVLVSLHRTKNPDDRIGSELLKLDIYNHTNACKSLGSKDFVTDNLGRFVSPDFYLLP
ncbi:MAG: SGNH/GDSL hydrolase family protein [Rhizomicrobium sp.]